MPSDLITVDYQFQLGTLLHGPGSTFENDEAGWSGLGLPSFKTQDVELDGADGAFLGRDFYAARILTFPILWTGTPEEVMDALTDLNAAWGRSELTDVDLYMRLPGWGVFHVSGRPRGLTEDLSLLPHGIGAALLTFQTADPELIF